MIPFLSVVDTNGDASDIIWLIVGVLAIIALFMFIFGRR